jgi:IPT/TIG domain-containing protein/putative pyrroloquinoline-quinone binding quinoprotein
VSCLLVLWLAAMPALAYDWLQMNGDPQHSGNNSQETILSSGNVASLAFLFQASLPSVADGAPVSLSAVTTPLGTRDLLFVTTKAGHILALDAHTGASIWSQQVGPGTCTINGSGGACYTTSSPAIDPNRLFVYSYGLDGKVHKYQVGDGAEVMTGGWPELTTTKGFNEKGSSALSFATSGGATYLYVTHGGYPGDNGDYQGHVTAIDLATGTQNVFNSACSDQAVHFVQTPGSPDCSHRQSAIWARVGVVYDSVTDKIFMGTGNGDYDGNVGMNDWGDSIIALSPDGTGSLGKPLDSYTPKTFASLQSADQDLGSTAPAILPAPGYSGRLAVQGGKDGKLRLINLENLSGMGGPGNVGGQVQTLNVPQGCVVLTAPAVWVNPADSSTWVFVANGCGISGLKLTVTGGVPSLAMQWQTVNAGASPLVANNVLYYAGSNVIRALNPVNGNALWSNTTKVGGIHWQSPVVVNGVLYISDQSARVTAFALPLTAQSISPRWGPTAGATAATILGSGFLGGASVSFGGASASSVSVVSPTKIDVATPPHAAGTFDVVITNPGGLSATLTNGFTYLDGADFFTLAPCRVLDTRNPNGPLGGPALGAGTERRFTLAGTCGIPASAKAVSINVTVTQSTAAGFVTLFQGLTALPQTASLDYSAGQTRANNAVVALGSAGDVTVHSGQASGTVQVIIDVNGYFQ